MSRGGREGNNAFTKDLGVNLFDDSIFPKDILQWNLSKKFINELVKSKKLDKNELVEHVVSAVR